MRSHEAITWIIYTWVLVLIGGCPLDNQCHSKQFYGVQDSTYSDGILLRKGPIPLNSCRRICRVYVECVAFSLEGSDPNTGICTIYKGDIKHTDLITKDGSTIYMLCPMGFQWHTELKKCYTSSVQGYANWTQAVDTCTSLFPGSRLVEPRNEKENAELPILADYYDIWIGLYRQGDELLDIHYKSDGRPVTYLEWGIQQPNNRDGNEKCLRAHMTYGYVWYDDTCDLIFNFLCEIA